VHSVYTCEHNLGQYEALIHLPTDVNEMNDLQYVSRHYSIIPLLYKIINLSQFNRGANNCNTYRSIPSW